MDTVEASDSLPHSRTLHPALPDVTDIATSDPIESRTDTQTTLQQETVTHDTNILHAETADTMASGSADAAIDENAGPVNLT